MKTVCPLCGSLAELPLPAATAAEMADRLAAGKAVLCPQSKRGHLTGLLKRRGISTRQRTLPDNERTVLFTQSAERNFKP